MKTQHHLAAFAAFALMSASANAALVSQFGILDLAANGGINPNTGAAWVAGDQYRLAFHTLGAVTATSNDPAFYDNFATTQAQSSGLGNGSITSSVGWTAMVWVNTDITQAQGVGPISSPLVRSGTVDLTGGFAQGGAGVPVYAFNGTTAIARNNADIYNSWSNPFESALATVQADGTGNNTQRVSGVFYSPFLDQNGNQTVNVDAIHGKTNWTGGFGSAVNALGDAPGDVRASHGSSNANNSGRVWNRQNSDNVTSYGVYAISPLLTVTFIPEPSTALLGAIGALVLLRRRRRN